MSLAEQLRRIEQDGKPLSYRVVLKHTLNEIKRNFVAGSSEDFLTEARKRIVHSSLFDVIFDAIDILPPPIQIYATQVAWKDQTNADIGFMRLMLSWEIEETHNHCFMKGLVVSAPSNNETIQIYCAKFTLGPQGLDNITKILPTIEELKVKGEAEFAHTLDQDGFSSETILESAIADALFALGMRAPK